MALRMSVGGLRREEARYRQDPCMSFFTRLGPHRFPRWPFDEFALLKLGSCPHQRHQVWAFKARRRCWAESMSLRMGVSTLAGKSTITGPE